ncbi:MAG: DUF2953 domain-containing protein [Clostridia bacterium]|nr:DUF2953 domain-containing protein [Clostridia bacterium]
MTALYIILIIVAVIALIIFIPIDISFAISYIEKNTDIKLTVSYFPIYLTILQAKKKEEKPEDDKKEKKPKKEKEKKEKEKQPLSKTIEFAKAVLEETLDDILGLIRHFFAKTLRVRQFLISAKIGTGDPMYTGIAYGAANAFIYELLGFIDHHTKLDKWNVQLDTDFDSFVIDADTSVIVRTRIAYILKLGFMAALILIKILKINRRIKKNG